MTKKLARNWFGHQAGETVQILSLKRAGLYRVRFEDGSTDVIGSSSLV